MHTYDSSRLVAVRGLVAKLTYSLTGHLFSLRSNVDTIDLVPVQSGITENSYWASCSARVEARWPSLRVQWRHSHSAWTSIRYWHERHVLGGHCQPAAPPSMRHYAPCDIECISMTNHVFCTRPYCSDQSDTLWHKLILPENIYSNMESMYVTMM